MLSAELHQILGVNIHIHRYNQYPHNTYSFITQRLGVFSSHLSFILSHHIRTFTGKSIPRVLTVLSLGLNVSRSYVQIAIKNTQMHSGKMVHQKSSEE